MLGELSSPTWSLRLPTTHDIKTGNKSFKIVAKFIYLRNLLRNVDCLHEEIMNTLSVGNSGNHYVQFAIK